MAQRVVDILEVIDIEMHDGDPVVGQIIVAAKVPEHIIQPPAVGQPGQGIMAAIMLHLGAGAFKLFRPLKIPCDVDGDTVVLAANFKVI